jgi:hypothetical protein
VKLQKELKAGTFLVFAEVLQKGSRLVLF